MPRLSGTNHLARFAAVAVLVAAVAGRLQAQGGLPGLGVQGTAAYSLIWNSTTSAAGTLNLGGPRFAGRIALALGPRWFAGITVGSWQTAPHFPAAADGGQSDTVATAVLVSPYLQLYPMQHRPVFVRIGLGYAGNRTYFEPGSVVGRPDLLIARTTSAHLSITGGCGVDVPVRQYLAVTMSADRIVLLGPAHYGEFTSGMQLGLGLTVR